MATASLAQAPVALVTGASEGIGEAICTALVRDGYRVAMMARRSQRLDDAAAALGEAAFAVACDLRSLASIERGVEDVRKRCGRLDVLVNCASATRFGNVLGISDEEWVTGFEVKVFGALRLTRAAWPHLSAARGSVVNIGGIGARTPRDGSAMTGPLSAALLALTKVFADRGVADGVRVNAINPGPVLTPRLLAMLDARARAADSSLEDAIGAMERHNQVTRLGRPEDVAALVAYLVSPAAELLQGAIIDLDGGMTKSW